jgi:tRNA(adenine34) deaminase
LKKRIGAKTILRVKQDLRDPERAMRVALGLARRAARRGEVPVGALVMRGGAILGRGSNRRESASDPTHHAEIEAIRRAAHRLGSWRLEGCDLYVTMEPCAMCAGACVNARIRKIIFGCKDPKAGYVESLGSIVRDHRLNHRCEVLGGVLEAECGAVLKEFFRARRGGQVTGDGRVAGK